MAIGTTGALIAGSVASAGIGAVGASKAAKAQQKGADASIAFQREALDETRALMRPYYDEGRTASQAYNYMLGLGDAPIIGGTLPGITEIPGATEAGRWVENERGRKFIPGQKSPSAFLVGDQRFSTREEAEAYANANKTGGKAFAGYMESPMAKYLIDEGMSAIEGARAKAGGLFSGASLKALEDDRRRVIGADVDNYMNRIAGVGASGQNAGANLGAAAQGFANSAGNATMAAANAKAGGYLGMSQAIQGGIGDVAGIMGYMGGPMGAFATPMNDPNWLFGGSSWS